MLRIVGQVLGVERRTVERQDAPNFDVWTVHVLDGFEVTDVTASREAEGYARSLTKGQHLDAPVQVEPFARRGGGAGVRYRLMLPEDLAQAEADYSDAPSRAE